MVQSGWTEQKKSLAQDEIKISRRYTGSFITCACLMKLLMRYSGGLTYREVHPRLPSKFSLSRKLAV
jgi:hypothetical protein